MDFCSIWSIIINSLMEEREGSKRGDGGVQEVPSYRKVNAYTRKPSYEQLLTLLLFSTVIVLHSVFVVPAIAKQASPILWVLLGSSYLILLLVAYDYCYITCTDPVDSLLLASPDEGVNIRKERVRECW